MNLKSIFVSTCFGDFSSRGQLSSLALAQFKKSGYWQLTGTTKSTKGGKSICFFNCTFNFGTLIYCSLKRKNVNPCIKVRERPNSLFHTPRCIPSFLYMQWAMSARPCKIFNDPQNRRSHSRILYLLASAHFTRMVSMTGWRSCCRLAHSETEWHGVCTSIALKVFYGQVRHCVAFWMNAKWITII